MFCFLEGHLPTAAVSILNGNGQMGTDGTVVLMGLGWGAGPLGLLKSAAACSSPSLFLSASCLLQPPGPSD